MLFVFILKKNHIPLSAACDPIMFTNPPPVLCVFALQAEVLTGLPAMDLPSASTAIMALQCTGTKCIILTLGEKGLLYSMAVGRDGLMEWTTIEHIEAETVKVVDTSVS